MYKNLSHSPTYPYHIRMDGLRMDLQATRILGIGTLAIWALGSRLVQVVRSLSGADSVPADHGDGRASRPHSYGVRSALRASAQHAQGAKVPLQGVCVCDRA